MKFAQVPELAIRDPELTPSEFKVLVGLFLFAKKTGVAWPKRALLAELCGLKDETGVSKITARLERKGWLTKGEKTSGRGAKKYQISIPERLKNLLELGFIDGTEGGETGHLNRSRGGETDHLRGGETGHLNRSRGGETDHLRGGETGHLNRSRGGETGHLGGGETRHSVEEHTNEHTNKHKTSCSGLPKADSKKIGEGDQGGSGSLVGMGATDSPPDPVSKKIAKPENPRYRSAAEAMWKKIQPLTSQPRPPNFDHWARDVRLLVERDGRALEDVWRVFEFANADEFWRVNILSPAKLRKQFSALYARMGRGAAGRCRSRDRSLTDDLTDSSWADGIVVAKPSGVVRPVLEDARKPTCTVAELTIEQKHISRGGL